MLPAFCREFIQSRPANNPRTVTLLSFGSRWIEQRADLMGLGNEGLYGRRSMATTDLVIIISTHPVVSGYARESARALAELGVKALAIDTEGTAVETAAWRLTLPCLDPAPAPLVCILPLQFLAYRIAESQGLDPNTRLHLKNDETRFHVSRMLTRRSLLGTGQ